MKYLLILPMLAAMVIPMYLFVTDDGKNERAELGVIAMIFSLIPCLFCILAIVSLP